VSDLDRAMHRSLWVLVAHISFIEGSHTTKNTASVLFIKSINDEKSFITLTSGLCYKRVPIVKLRFHLQRALQS
jgi:hypothetical protein